MENDHGLSKRRIEVESKIREHVKNFGCHVQMVFSSGYGPAFAYTIGLMENYGQPELILFGLDLKLMHILLNQFSAFMRDGKTFEIGMKYDDFLEGYNVQLIPVIPENYIDFLGAAGQYYGHWNFPVMQVIWPDKEHHWPWEENFNPKIKYAQPLLDKIRKYKFPEAPDTSVHTTYHALEGKPILFASHDHEGVWQFHTEESPVGEDFKLVSLGSIVTLDPSLNELDIMGYGKIAERTAIGAEWVIRDMPKEETDDEEYDGSEEPNVKIQTSDDTQRKTNILSKFKGLWN